MQRRLGEILIDRGSISENQLKEALRAQPSHSTFIGQVLFRLGVPLWEIEDALSEQRDAESRKY